MDLIIKIFIGAIEVGIIAVWFSLPIVIWFKVDRIEAMLEDVLEEKNKNKEKKKGKGIISKENIQEIITILENDKNCNTEQSCESCKYKTAAFLPCEVCTNHSEYEKDKKIVI